MAVSTQLTCKEGTSSARLCVYRNIAAQKR